MSWFFKTPTFCIKFETRSSAECETEKRFWNFEQIHTSCRVEK